MPDKSPQDVLRDEALTRMLKTPPRPHKKALIAKSPPKADKPPK